VANLKIAPGVKPKKTKQAKRGSRKPRRRRANHGGWLTTAKIVFLLERRRRRREGESSSPSVRQIALIVVSAGLAILVIRVAAQRARSHAGSTEVETAQEETAKQETAQPEQETAQPETQNGPVETNSSPPPSGDDDATATESALTDRIQSEMARHDDAPTPSAGSD